jgi:TonB family protein
MKGKLNVMKSRPEVSDEEIRQSMDFGKLLIEKQKFEQSQRRLRRNRNAMLALVAFILVSGSFYLIVYHPFDGAQTANVQGREQGSEITDKATPSTATDTEGKVDLPEDAVKSGEEATPQEKNKSNKKDQPLTPSPADTQSAEPKKAADVYEQASPVDGYPALYEYFGKELRYPRVKEKDSVDGVVTVIFTIDKTGKPVDIQIENSLGPEFDREAARLIEKMPDWNPARFNGQPVPSKISVPLTFETEKVIIK